MLVSAQTDRLVMRKNAPRINNQKGPNDLLRRSRQGRPLRPGLKPNYRLGIAVPPQVLREGTVKIIYSAKD
jgi:hypothetical protein